MHFQWYPGHMTKARRMMQENIKLIDLIIELVDARVPLSSRNPDIDELGKNKARLILLNKADLAEDRKNDEWLEYFKGKGYSAVKVNSRKGGGIKSIQSVIQEACREKTERDRKRGILNRPVRAMVVGIPNVGKSTFINALAGKACAKTGNKPGVTKGKQWIRLNKNVELLDTPGILWPKFEDQAVGLKLAFIGSIKDEILQTEELAAELAGFLNREYPGVLEEKYGIETSEDRYECLRRIAESRHCLVRGSELDTEKAAGILLAFGVHNGGQGQDLPGAAAQTSQKEGKQMKSILKELVGWIIYILIIVGLAYLIITFVGQRTQVSGSSMETTLSDGDQLIVDKISYRFRDPKRFDIVVFPYQYEENTYYIKRIIGLPGETVQIIDGYVYINGTQLDEHYGNAVMKDAGMAAEPVTLGDDEYFVLGDNRNNSQDSRAENVGVIHRDDLLGRAWIRIWPLSEFGVIRHE